MIIRGHAGVEYEPHDARTERYPAHELIGMGGPAPVMPLVDHVLLYDGKWPDQGLAERCCGDALAQAIHIRLGAMGVPRPKRFEPSPNDIYYRGRASRHGWQNVIDIGSNPVACWEVCRAAVKTPHGLGIASLKDLPADPFTVDDPPDPAIYRRAVDVDWLRYHWVLEGGADRLVQVDALLRAGRPVTAALTCDKGILSWRPEDGPWRYVGPREGGHYVCLVHVDDEGHYWAIGTWGPNYGASGLHRIARSEIASSRTSYLATPVIDPEKIHA